MRGHSTTIYSPLEIVHGPERKAWELQPNESVKHYEWFCAFKQMDPAIRSLSAVAQKFGKKEATVIRIASEWKWRERIAYWHDFLSTSEIEAKKKEIEEMNRETAKQAKAIKNSLIVPVYSFLKKLQEGKINFEDLPAEKHLMMVIKSATYFSIIADAERKAKGEPTEITRSSIDHTTGGETLKPQIVFEVNGSQSKLLNEMLKDFNNEINKETDSDIDE
jgi:hypothetical protein